MNVKRMAAEVNKAFRAPQLARQSVRSSEVRFMISRLQGEHRNGFTCPDVEHAIILLGFVAEAMEAHAQRKRKAVA